MEFSLTKHNLLLNQQLEIPSQPDCHSCWRRSRFQGREYEYYASLTSQIRLTKHSADNANLTHTDELSGIVLAVLIVISCRRNEVHSGLKMPLKNPS